MRAKEWVARVTFGGGGDAVALWLGRLVAGVPFEIAGVDVIPVVLPGAFDEPDFLAADAMTRGALEVTELPDARVANVLATNRGDEAVLVLEGDILVGCKQNRIVARSALIPPRARAEIPVACVEQGRWSQEGACFRPGAVRAEPSLRRRTVGSVSQARVWNEVASSLGAAGVRSPSGDYEAYLASRTAKRSREGARLPEIRDQVGVIATHAGRLLGLELVGHPATFARLRDRTIPGYLSEAYRSRRATSAQPTRDPGAWLDALRRASVRTAPGIAAGQDLSLSGNGLAGRGLWNGDRLLYLAAFPA